MAASSSSVVSSMVVTSIETSLTLTLPLKVVLQSPLSSFTQLEVVKRNKCNSWLQHRVSTRMHTHSLCRQARCSYRLIFQQVSKHSLTKAASSSCRHSHLGLQ